MIPAVDTPEISKFSIRKPTANPQLYKYYVYFYLIKDVIKYVGRGSDAGGTPALQYKRAKDFATHNNLCQTNKADIQILIHRHYTTRDNAKFAEAMQILEYDCLEENGGFNRRREIKTGGNSYLEMFETVYGNTKEDSQTTQLDIISRETSRLIIEAKGSNQSEPLSLADKIIPEADVLEGKDILFIGNDQFGILPSLEVAFNRVMTNGTKPKFQAALITTKDAKHFPGVFEMMKDSRLQLHFATENFLTQDFKDRRFDLIIMNPPWSTYGIQFIEKAVSLLRPGGKLITIMGLDQFSPMSYKNAHKKGTFWWLNQKGVFEHIETARHDGAWGTQKFFPGGNGASCWFIWRNERAHISTSFINKLKEEFIFNLTGIEWMIPEEPYEVIKDYVDWGPNGISFNRSPGMKDSHFSFLISESQGGYNNMHGIVSTDKKNGPSLRTFLKNVPREHVDDNKVKSFLYGDGEKYNDLMARYSAHTVTALRHYPVKPSLFLKDVDLDDERQ